MAALLFSLVPCLLTLVSPLRLEAEDAQQFGTHVAKERVGYSGTGYVTGFVDANAHILWKFKTAGGVYDVRIGYSAPSGQKGYELVVDGVKSSGMFAGTGDKFGVASAGKVELRPGENTVEIDRGWGYFDVDYVEFVPTRIEKTLPKPPGRPCDPRATPEARALFSKLRGVYGRGTFSGQYDVNDCRFVAKTAGVTPAIVGDDLMEYSPSRIEFGAHPDGVPETCIRAAKAGQVVTMSWHWNAPKGLLNKKFKDANGNEVDASWYKGFYTVATTFDLAAAMADPSSQAYRLILRDIDAIAVQLKKLSDAHVPVLWRPLHEAEGGWFWWGAKGPEPFKLLWKLMYKRLTVDHGLHNLIWVYSSGTNPDWYPGDEFVDVVGIDAYPSDPEDALSQTWEQLQSRFGGKKLLAISEFGGVPDVERMRRFGVFWDYFVSWTGDLGARGVKPDALKRLYTAQAVLNRR